MDYHMIQTFIIFVFLSLSKNKWGILISFILLIWLFSFRTNDIPDTEVYSWMYEDPISRLGHNEIGFLFLGYIFKSITNAEFIVYYLTLVSVSFLLWYYSSRRLLSENEQWGILLLLFVSFFGFLYMGVLIRNCLSELLVLCGLSFFITRKGRKKYLLYLLFVLLATLVHKSSIFFLLLIPLIRIKLSLRFYFYLFIACFTIWLISGVGLAKEIVGEISEISIFSNYDKFASSTEKSPNMFSLQILISMLVSYCAVKSKKTIELGYRYVYNSFLKINMVGLFVLSIIWSLPTSYRFYNMFFFFNYILIYLMIFHNDRIKSMKKKITYSLSISVVYFFILMYSFSFLLLY